MRVSGRWESNPRNQRGARRSIARANSVVVEDLHMPVVKIGAGHLYDAYYRVMDAEQAPGWDGRQAVEVTKRLKQLDWLLLEVQRREIDVVGDVLSLADPRRHQLMDEIHLLAE